jgi:hypothetical protein
MVDASISFVTTGLKNKTRSPQPPEHMTAAV